MKQNNTQTIFIHTNITLICIILLSTGSSGADYRYEACVPKNCGRGPNITFPFYIPGLQEPYCGYPGFALACTPPRNSPVLHFPGIEYEVEDIFYHTRSLRVYNLVLSSLSSNGTNTNCLPDIRNTTVPPTQFGFADNVTRLHLFSNCSDRFISNSSSSLGRCGDRAWMYEEDGRYGRAVESCRRNVVAPVEMGAVGWDVVEVMKKGFVMKWKASVCSKCERSGGRCGFNETIYHFRCFCPDRPHSRRCKPEKSRTTAIIATAISGSLVFILCLLIPFIIWKCKKRITISCVVSRKKSFDPSSKTDIEGGSYFGIPIFCYAQLEEATNSFDASKELGDGGFGTVYYGKLRDGREVAVKRLYKHDYRTMDQFINEIKILTCLRHKNLVSLYGCTSRRSKDLLLVYEYIPNGTVADHLHGGKSPLPWPVRMDIAVETASALAYLHKSDIIHRDVKTDNILLDANFCVKVADFGLSRLFPNDVTHISTAPQGTPGYVDPEYHQCYRLTDRSDVYSFGVVLIELISSMRAVDIGRQRDEVNLANLAVSRIQRRAFDELIDPSLGYECDEGVRRMTNSVAELAFRCLQVEMEMRPSMDEVLEILKEIRGGDELKFEKNKGTNLNILITEEGKNFHSSPIAVIGTWYSSASTTGSVG